MRAEASRGAARQRRWAALVTAGLSVSTALALVAFSLYPEPGGYDFLGEYWCDLYDPRTSSGRENPARWWAVGATGALGAALACLLASLEGASWRWVRRLGWLGCAGFGLVPAVTAAGRLDLHRLFVLTTGPVGLAAIALLVVKSPHRAAAWAGWALLVVGAWNTAVYAAQSVLGLPRQPWLPAVQKLVTLTLFVWMLALAWAPRGRSDAASGA